MVVLSFKVNDNLWKSWRSLAFSSRIHENCCTIVQNRWTSMNTVVLSCILHETLMKIRPPVRPPFALPPIRPSVHPAFRPSARWGLAEPRNINSRSNAKRLLLVFCNGEIIARWWQLISYNDKLVGHCPHLVSVNDRLVTHRSINFCNDKLSVHYSNTIPQTSAARRVPYFFCI